VQKVSERLSLSPERFSGMRRRAEETFLLGGLENLIEAGFEVSESFGIKAE